MWNPTCQRVRHSQAFSSRITKVISAWLTQLGATRAILTMFATQTAIASLLITLRCYLQKMTVLLSSFGAADLLALFATLIKLWFTRNFVEKMALLVFTSKESTVPNACSILHLKTSLMKATLKTAYKASTTPKMAFNTSVSTNLSASVAYWVI